MRTYSDFFKTLHDETGPTGRLGQGTHHSVLRAVVFHDPMGTPLSEGRFADFAVIWDEDHDARVMEPIEKIYRLGLLSSFVIFGEHKGSFTAILSDRVLSNDESPINPVLFRKVSDFELSLHSANILNNENIVYIGDLVQKTEGDMLRMPNCGRKWLNEIKEILAPSRTGRPRTSRNSPQISSILRDSLRPAPVKMPEWRSWTQTSGKSADQ